MSDYTEKDIPLSKLDLDLDNLTRTSIQFNKDIHPKKSPLIKRTPSLNKSRNDKPILFQSQINILSHKEIHKKTHY